MSLRLEPAKTLDAGIVGAILSAGTDTVDWLPRLYSRAEELRFASDMIASGWVTVARNGDETVGFSAVRGEELNALYVAPHRQGQGVGTDLLNAAQTGRAKLGLWSYQANIAASRFYARHGFCEITRTDGAGNEAKLPDIRFEWERTP